MRNTILCILKLILALTVIAAAVITVSACTDRSGGNFTAGSDVENKVESDNPVQRPVGFTEGIWIRKYPGGYASFKFELPDGFTFVCDPYQMDEIISPDFVTSSHMHSDHADYSKLTGRFETFMRKGDFEYKGFPVSGIAGSHNKGDREVSNIIFVMDINGIRIAHFAAQGQMPDDRMFSRLKGTDVLLIQVFNEPDYSDIKLTVSECCEIIDRLDPRIVIPEHGSSKIGEEIAEHYHTTVEYVDRGGFVITEKLLKNIKGHKIVDMDYQ